MQRSHLLSLSYWGAKLDSSYCIKTFNGHWRWASNLPVLLNTLTIQNLMLDGFQPPHKLKLGGCFLFDYLRWIRALKAVRTRGLSYLRLTSGERLPAHNSCIHIQCYFFTTAQVMSPATHQRCRCVFLQIKRKSGVRPRLGVFCGWLPLAELISS